MAKIDSSFFDLECNDGVAHLIMNRPEKANGMSPDFWTDLPRMVRTLEHDTAIRAVVISGRGKHFSGGMDLSAFEGIFNLTQQEPGRGAYALRKLILELQDSFTALETVRFPVIAAIHGACLGGAIDMITACDIRLSSDDAFYGIEEIEIGMAADVGTLQRLPKLINPGIARELAYTGRRIEADEAVQIGLCSRTCGNHEETVAAALELASEIASKSPLAIAGIKQAVLVARDQPVAQALDQIATWNAGMLRPDDLQKAMKARMAKQTAVFDDLLATSA